MNDYSPEERQKIWKNACPLIEAIQKYADPKSVPDYLRISAQNIKNPSSISESALQLFEVLSKYPQQQNKLYDNLYEQLGAGALIGIGYEMPIKSSDFPTFIPPNLWPPEKCHGGKSEIWVHGLHFVRVRIIAKSNLPQLAAKQFIEPLSSFPKIEIKNKPVGRPTHKEKIITAYQWLKNNNQIDFSKPLKAHTEIIQKAVLHLNPELKYTNGMEYEAVRRVIMPLFKADKKTSKSTSKL